MEVYTPRHYLHCAWPLTQNPSRGLGRGNETTGYFYMNKKNMPDKLYCDPCTSVLVRPPYINRWCAGQAVRIPCWRELRQRLALSRDRNIACLAPSDMFFLFIYYEETNVILTELLNMHFTPPYSMINVLQAFCTIMCRLCVGKFAIPIQYKCTNVWFLHKLDIKWAEIRGVWSRDQSVLLYFVEIFPFLHHYPAGG